MSLNHGDVEVAAAQSARAISAGHGELIQVVDIEGHQVGDM